MSSNQLIAFAQSQPFIPYIATLLDGRKIEIRHPEFAVLAFAGAVLWVLHNYVHVEAIEGALIVSIKSIDPVDPHSLTG